MPVFHALLDALGRSPRLDPVNHPLNMPDRMLSPHKYGDFVLRPVLTDDEEDWTEVRCCNSSWLEPWEAGDPEGSPGLTFHQWVSSLRKAEDAGSGAVFLMEFQKQIVGQISLGAICYGAMRTATVGYWVDQGHIGNGFAPLAVAMLADWAFFSPSGPHLHRIEIDILPENKRSLTVVRKLGMHNEGLRKRYMFIRGQWRDHLAFSLLSDECEGGVVNRLSMCTRDTPVNT
ncbi:GNAT family N-acetyltransferase [Bombiscardovia coagulans]|uniref:Acetyltransferase n=1 Tax=Bombiscardovia coagulans TaxID=686666 RepID=A0A261EU01_9BIFI|nr:acetyltransferase [Bombiscardovia coagulans]